MKAMKNQIAGTCFPMYRDARTGEDRSQNAREKDRPT